MEQTESTLFTKALCTITIRAHPKTVNTNQGIGFPMSSQRNKTHTFAITEKMR